MPNYAFVGNYVKASRLLPIGNFMSFPAEIMRTDSCRTRFERIKTLKTSESSNATPYVIDAATGQLVKNDNPMYATGF